MAYAIVDLDTIFRKKEFFPNLEAMKVASYFSKKGKDVKFLTDPNDSFNYERTFVFRNSPRMNVERGYQKSDFPETAEFYGLYYTDNIYVPMSEEIEATEPNFKFYAPIAKEKIINNYITFKQVENLSNSSFVRLMSGQYEYDLKKVPQSKQVYVYDTHLEAIPDWRGKLTLLSEKSKSQFGVKPVNKFFFYSIENMMSAILEQNISGSSVFTSHDFTYKEFTETVDKFVDYKNKICFGIFVGEFWNPFDDAQMLKNFLLLLNFYCYTTSIGKRVNIENSQNIKDSKYYKLFSRLSQITAIEKVKKSKNIAELFCRPEQQNILKSISNKRIGRSIDNILHIDVESIKRGWYFHD